MAALFKWTADSKQIKGLLAAVDAAFTETGVEELQTEHGRLSFIFNNVFDLTDDDGSFVPEDESVLTKAPALWAKVNLKGFPTAAKAKTAIIGTIAEFVDSLEPIGANSEKTTPASKTPPPAAAKKSKTADKPASNGTAAAATNDEAALDYSKFRIAIANCVASIVGTDPVRMKAFLTESCNVDRERPVETMYETNGVAEHWVKLMKAYAAKHPVPQNSVRVPSDALSRESPALHSKADIRERYTLHMEYRDKKSGKVTHAEYLKVPGRVLLFRLDHPAGAITTELLKIEISESPDATFAMFRASIHGADGVLMATAHALTTEAMAERAKGRFLEMAESQAIGRALGLCGYGTDELSADDNSDVLADSPVDNADAAD